MLYVYALHLRFICALGFFSTSFELGSSCLLAHGLIKIHQRGVQWKQGVVVYTILYAVLLFNTAPIHCTPSDCTPILMNTRLSEMSSSLYTFLCKVLMSKLPYGSPPQCRDETMTRRSWYWIGLGALQLPLLCSGSELAWTNELGYSFKGGVQWEGGAVDGGSIIW